MKCITLTLDGPTMGLKVEENPSNWEFWSLAFWNFKVPLKKEWENTMLDYECYHSRYIDLRNRAINDLREAATKRASLMAHGIRKGLENTLGNYYPRENRLWEADIDPRRNARNRAQIIPQKTEDNRLLVRATTFTPYAFHQDGRFMLPHTMKVHEAVVTDKEYGFCDDALFTMHAGQGIRLYHNEGKGGEVQYHWNGTCLNTVRRQGKEWNSDIKPIHIGKRIEAERNAIAAAYQAIDALWESSRTAA